MSKSISPMLFLMPEAKPFRASPRSHRSDEFAVGYSLAVCSPALPASASPAGIHLQTAGSYLSTVSFGKISKLDSKVRTRQNINVRGGPNQSIEVGQTGVSNSSGPKMTESTLTPEKGNLTINPSPRGGPLLPARAA